MSFSVIEMREGSIYDLHRTSSLKKAEKLARERAKERGFIQIEPETLEWCGESDTLSGVLVWDDLNSRYAEAK